MNYKIKKVLEELTPEEREEVWLQLSNADLNESRMSRIELVSIGELEEATEERYKSWGKLQGIGTGYESLDELTKGLVPGELIVVAGMTSHGKTSLAVNMAYKQQEMGNLPLFVTLEMTHIELASKFRHIHGAPVGDINVLFQKNDELGWRDIDALIAKAKKNGVKAVFIDHLHYFTRELDNVSEDLGRISKEMKKNAIRHDIPIVLISHVRKLGGKKEPDIEDLRGSSYIAQDADIVLMVFRDQEYPNVMLVRVDKNRNRGFDPNHPTRKFKFDGAKLDDGWV